MMRAKPRARVLFIPSSPHPSSSVLRCRPQTSRLVLATGLLFLLGGLPVGHGCPYSIRDAGFIVREPTPYRLYVLTKDNMPKKDPLPQWLSEAADRYLKDSNLEMRLPNTDREDRDVARAHFRSLGASAVPSALLLSPTNEAIRLPGLGPGNVSRQAAYKVIASAVTSPGRQELAAHLIKPWCVIVLAKGTDAAANRRAEKEVAQAAKAAHGSLTEMEGSINKAPYVMSVSCADPAEKVLLWSLGMDEGSKATPRAAVVFGRGWRAGPVFKGGQVTEAALLEVIRTLGQNCSCTSDPSWLLGPVVPLPWPRVLDEQLSAELGFDPNSPVALSTLSGVWKSVGKRGANRGRTLDYGHGYLEFSAEPVREESEEPVTTESDSSETVKQSQTDETAAPTTGSQIEIRQEKAATSVNAAPERRSKLKQEHPAKSITPKRAGTQAKWKKLPERHAALGEKEKNPPAGSAQGRRASAKTAKATLKAQPAVKPRVARQPHPRTEAASPKAAPANAAQHDPPTTPAPALNEQVRRLLVAFIGVLVLIGVASTTVLLVRQRRML